MAIKELQTRIALKYDSYSAWHDESVADQGANLVLLPGELGICYIGDANQGSNVVPTVLFKVGDGTKTFKQLPWASAKAADVYSWAKASEVKRDGKKLVFVGGAANGTNLEVPFDYCTIEEVKAITNGLDTRITALEGKFSGENDVQGQIDALGGRLDVIEGEAAGSIKKALADAKAYTDEREDAIETAYKAYADQAETDAISAAEAKVAVERARIAAVEGDITTIKGEGDGSIKKALADAKSYADQAELDAVATAKSYTDDREAAIKTAYEAYADEAEQGAKDYADAEIKKVTDAQAITDAAQNTEIGKKLDKTTYEAYIVGKSMSDADLKAYADGVASDEADAAQSAAIAAAKTETQNQIKALVEEGQVKTNTGAIAQNKSDIAAMDTAYKKAVSDEAKAREDADKALDERLDAVEAFFVTAEGETIDKALDTLVEIQEYLNGDGSATGGIIDRVAQAESDIDNLEKEFADGGRVKVAEGKVAALETKASELETEVGKKLATETFNTWKTGHEADHAGTATEITAEIAEAVAGEKSLREAADKAITDAIGAKGDAATANTVYGAIADAKAAGTQAGADVAALGTRVGTAETNIGTLQDLVSDYTGKGAIKAAIEAAAAKGQTGIDNAATAQAAADKAQGEVDALETVVAGVKSTADTAKTDLAALTGRVTTAEGKITTAEGKISTLEGIVNDASKGNEKLRTDVNALQTLTGEGGAIEVAIADAKKAGTDAAASVKALSDGQVATNKTDIANIKADYLKAADAYIFNCGTATTVNHKAN